MKRIAIALVLLFGPSSSFSQTVQTITAAGLGYTVPIPVSSLTPVAGYRTAASLKARYEDLVLQKSFITETQTGTSRNSRAIYSYRFHTSAETTPEGIAKSAAMIQGTIHPREWASPEVVTGVFEWLALQNDSDPIAHYLLDNMEIVIHPIGNPDAFAVTQTFPTQTVNGGNTGLTFNVADGRMRRKNLRSADEVLSTTGDASQGVDLNRNHAVGFGMGQSSGALTNETYRGPSAGSEPESTALYAAANLIDTNRLRFYTDFHSYGPDYYLIFDSSSNRTAAVTEAYNIMHDATVATSGVDYSSITVQLPSGAEGATDEYFAGTYFCMSYTCEIRPNLPSSNNGFILSDAQIDAVRDELLASTRAGFYYAAGPAALIDIRIYDTTAGRTESSALVFREQRTYNAIGGVRARVTNQIAALKKDHVYTAVLQLNKPMRLKNVGNGSAELLPGASGATTGTVGITGLASGTNKSWSFDTQGGHYGYTQEAGDTLLVDFDLAGSAAAAGSFPLSAALVDAAGKSIDTDPQTVADWSHQGWTNWETGSADALASVAFDPTEPSNVEGWTLF